MLSFEQEVAPRGNSLYYSLLNTDPQKRQAVIALHALSHELNKTAERYKEVSVAELKLSFWELEIKRLYANEPTHPITQALQAAIQTYPIPEATLQALVAAAKLALQTQLYSTQKDLEHHFHHAGGLLELLKARIWAEGKTDNETEQYAQTLGIALEIIRHLHQFAYDLKHGQLYLPSEPLTEAGVDINTLYDGKGLDALQPYFKVQVERAKTLYHDALKQLPKTQFHAQRPGRIYALLQIKLLEAMETDGLKVFSHQIELSPIKKLWISWRTK